jgi:hypothetical protein
MVGLLFAPRCCLEVRSPGLLRIEERNKKAAVPVVQRYPCDWLVLVVCRERILRRPKRRSRSRGKLSSTAQGRQPRERYLNGKHGLRAQPCVSRSASRRVFDDLCTGLGRRKRLGDTTTRSHLTTLVRETHRRTRRTVVGTLGGCRVVCLGANDKRHARRRNRSDVSIGTPQSETPQLALLLDRKSRRFVPHSDSMGQGTGKASNTTAASAASRARGRVIGHYYVCRGDPRCQP